MWGTASRNFLTADWLETSFRSRAPSPLQTTCWSLPRSRSWHQILMLDGLITSSAEVKINNGKPCRTKFKNSWQPGKLIDTCRRTLALISSTVWVNTARLDIALVKIYRKQSKHLMTFYNILHIYARVCVCVEVFIFINNLISQNMCFRIHSAIDIKNTHKHNGYVRRCTCTVYGNFPFLRFSRLCKSIVIGWSEFQTCWRHFLYSIFTFVLM